MLHRIGISITDAELKRLQTFQKRFGLNSRSEVVRELLRRFLEAEKEKEWIAQCVEAYRKNPETSTENEENKEILKQTVSDHPDESWS